MISEIFKHFYFTSQFYD